MVGVTCGDVVTTRREGAADSAEVLALIQRGMPLVETLAHYMRRRTFGHATLDDMRSAGREALVHAARSYDPARGVPFEAWATLRVRGGMIDSVRQATDVPKRVFRQLRALQAADDVQSVAAEEQAASPATSSEAADARLGDQLATAAMAMALGMLTKGKSDRLEEAPSDDRSPESQVSSALLIERVKQILAERSPEERLVIQRHYFEDVSMDEVGKELGVSKSWVSRLHTRAIEAIVRGLKRR